MVRILLRVLWGLLIVAVIFCVGDFVAWRLRTAHGNGTDSVEVRRVTVSTLKGNKEEYYSDGSDTLTCTVSTLPMPAADGFSTPCWWLRGHRQVITRY